MIQLLPRYVRNIPMEKCTKYKTVPISVKDRVIYMYNNVTIGLLHSNDSNSSDIEFLVGHAKPIMAMCISPGNAQFLCSCCVDTVNIWDLGSTSSTSVVQPEKYIIGVKFGPINFCALSYEWLAIGQDGKILIIKLKVPCNLRSPSQPPQYLMQIEVLKNGMEQLIDVEEYATFDQQQKALLASFSPSQPNILVVVDETAFMIWDVSAQQLVHQSLSFGTHSLTSCSLSEENSKLVIGTNKGKAHVYNLTQLSSPWNVITVDVNKSHSLFMEIKLGEESNASGCIVFSAKLFARSKKSEKMQHCEPFDRNQYKDTLRSILAPGTMLIVFSSLGITIFDCKSSNCLGHLYLQELIPGHSMALIDFAMLTGETLGKLACIVKSSEQGASVKIISLQCRKLTPKLPATASTVVARIPLVSSSVLCQQIKQLSKKSLYEPEEKWRKKTSKLIKSSCYGRETQQQMFVPKLNNLANKISAQKKKKSGSTILSTYILDASLIENYGPPKKNVQEVCISETAMPIYLSATGDGSYLGCTSSSYAICVVPFKSFDLGKSVTLIGHDAVVNALHFNHDSKWLISSSNDSKAKIWDWKNKKCLFNIDKKKELEIKNLHQKQSSCGPDVIDASFYYMDQFILVASSNNLEMYCHHLSDPILRPNGLRSFGVDQVHAIQVPSQQITCFSAANQLHSYIVLCGCSDKAVRVYDMNAEAFSVELPDAHSRPPHRLRQITGAACSPAMHNLFLSAALGDCVRLWDLRSSRCVQKYARHVTRTYAAGIDVSPCARYVAVCSEDKAVYIYDSRKPEDYLGRLAVRGDAAMNVAFSPNKPFLAASSLNGYVSKFSA